MGASLFRRVTASVIVAFSVGTVASSGCSSDESGGGATPSDSGTGDSGQVDSSADASIEADGAPLGTSKELTRLGITWTFDHEVPFGQFANGDYWVLGPVKVVAISPAPVSEDGGTEVRNGFEVNPLPGDHPYDSRAAGFDASKVGVLPLDLGAGSSLVSTISNPETHDCELTSPHPGFTNFQGDCYEGFVKVAAVLTVLATAPPDGSFRPPYAGKDKPLFSSTSLREDLLPSLAPTDDPPDLAALEARLTRVRLDHMPGWTAQQIIPIDSVGGYGAGMVTALGVSGLALMLDKPIAEKRGLLIQLVQTGIDLFGTAKNGGVWPADGGHGSGRKFPIVFAGLMLDDAEMLNIAKSGLGDFQEDCTTYYDDDPSYAFYYGVLGFPRWGIRHCQDPQAQKPDYHDESSGYRTCCNSQSWVAQTLTLRLLGLEKAWAHQAYFDYMDRWAQTENDGYWGSDWADAMWAKYRSSVDVCKNGVRDRCSVLCDPVAKTSSGELGVDCGGKCPTACGADAAAD